MAKVEAKPGQKKAVPKLDRVDQKLMGPGKYEVTPETMFSVKVYLKVTAGRWIVVSGPAKGIDTHEIIFRMWNYDEVVGLKKMATDYDTVRRMHTINNDTLNRLKVQKLMVSWTFDKENERLKLHRVQGTLTDESWDNFRKLQPNIITYILDRMNEVLDHNG